MTDRLAEIEVRLHQEMPAHAVVGLRAAELRALLAVAKAAGDVLGALIWDPSRHHELGSSRVCNTCGAVWPCEVALLRDALAALDRFVNERTAP